MRANACRLLLLIEVYFSLFFIGETAGEGNRTLVCSLGSCRSTIELHPRLEEVNSESFRE